MWGFIALAAFLLMLVIGIIKRNQKPANPDCPMCNGTGVVETTDYNGVPSHDWCECTYVNRGEDAA